MDLTTFVPEEIDIRSLSQTDFPRIAKDKELAEKIKSAVKKIPTSQRLVLGDARSMREEDIHLIFTSPPYWTIKKYEPIEGQLGVIKDYEEFLDELDKVWERCYDILVPGGRLVVVVGDACLSRRRYGRHCIMPLHSSIQERCRHIGFDNLAPIIWYKIANINFEVKGNGRFLGKPYEPNAIIKNDVEYILFMRKPGGYRSPDLAERVLSIIPEGEHHEYFQQIWTIQGASTKHHPAPFPLKLAERIVRMFSFVGDLVLDPFLGTGTTLLAAGIWGRNGIGYEIDPRYVQYSYKRLRGDLRLVDSEIQVERLRSDGTLTPLSLSAEILGSEPHHLSAELVDR